MTNNTPLEYALRQLSPTEQNHYHAAVRLYNSKDGVEGGRSAHDMLPEAIIEHYASIIGKVNTLREKYHARKRESAESNEEALGIELRLETA